MSPEQIAKEFAANLENNPDIRRQFLSENYQDSIWLQCPPYDGEPVNFWQYGPPIPGANGYIYWLGEIWYNSHLEGWIARYGDCASYLTNLAIDDTKKVIESATEKEYGAQITIDEGRFRTTAAVKIGAILLHPDWPLGIAARNIDVGEIIEYSSLKDTKDVILKAEKIISKSPPSHPLSVLDLGKTIIFDPEANKVGQDMFWYGILPIGVAVRDIQAGGILEYSSHKNTKMILKWEGYANTP